ncbi:MAG: OmpA family protein [Burkholderiaceae bacterium]
MNPTTTTMKFTLACAASILACAGAPAQTSATTPLAPAKDRITDEAIQRDHRAYEAMQARIKGLNDRGRPVRDYHLAKAQCWLDVSFHEYTRNDRGPFPQAALSEAEKLVQGMEAGNANLGFDTPLVGEAVQLRPDLWERAKALRAHAGFSCAQQKAACAEVELVHAGNEHAQQQWRHAKPYVQIAEDLLGEANALAQSCAQAVAAAPAPAPAPVIAAPAATPAPQQVTTERVMLAAHALFRFDRGNRGDLLPEVLKPLDDLAARLGQAYARVDRIVLTGYTDRLGNKAYNERLSLERANTVRAYLQAKGITAPMTTEGKGPADPITTNCKGNVATPALTACLQPDRRVELLVTGVKR